MWVVLAFLALASTRLAAVRPLTREDREREAQWVVRGEVLGTYQRQASSADGEDTEYVSCISTDGPRLVYAHYRRTGPRPGGWTGPVGQDSVMGEGDRVVAYLVADADCRWQLLEPNGWERE